MITHIVCWKVKDTDQSKEQNMQSIKNLLESLPAKISQILKLEVGIDVNRSEVAYDVALYSTFQSMEDLQAYQVHPAHVEVAAFIKQITEARMVVDYKN